MMAPPIARKATAALRRPGAALRHLWHSLNSELFWDARYQRVREPKVRGAVAVSDEAALRIESELRVLGVKVDRARIDVAAFRDWLRRGRYGRFDWYYDGGSRAGFVEKALEHFLAAQFLRLGSGDVYVDVASYTSPVPDIYEELHGVTAYRQDLQYKPGMHDRRIGGNAAEMPVADGFATKMALHCSFEHFEGNSDSDFIEEAARVLAPGGRLCIVPLYLAERYSIQLDPISIPRQGIEFESDALLCCARGWRNRHGRFYDVPHFVERVAEHLNGLRCTVFRIENAREVDPSCHVVFLGLFEKEPSVVGLHS
jgi:SAM-dependent methyltransferase